MPATNFGGLITTTLIKNTHFHNLSSSNPASITAIASRITIKMLGINICIMIPAPKHTKARPAAFKQSPFTLFPPSLYLMQHHWSALKRYRLPNKNFTPSSCAFASAMLSPPDRCRIFSISLSILSVRSFE